MLFVLIFVWFSSFVCICFVCLSPFVSDSPSVCLCPSVSRGLGVRVSLCFSGLCLSVCLSRTSCVSCLPCQCALDLLFSCVGLGCFVLSCLGLSCLVLSACHQSVLSLRCVYSSSRSPSFVCPSVIPFVLSLLCSFIRPRRFVLKFFLTRTQIKLSNLPFERFKTAAPPVLSKEHTARTRDTLVCSGTTPAKLPPDDSIMRSSATRVSKSSRKLERRNDASDSPKSTASSDVFWSAAKTCSHWRKMTFVSLNVSHFLPCISAWFSSFAHCRNMCCRFSARKSLSTYVWLTQKSQKLAEPPRLLRSSQARLF